MDEKKVCKKCLEEIKAGAVVCPHCTQLQGRAFENVRNVVFGLCLAGAIICLVYLLLSILFGSCRSSANYSANFGNLVEVVEPRIMPSDEEGSSKIVVLFWAKNHGKIDLDQIQFNAEFADANGTVFDVGSELKYGTVLNAGESMRMKLSFYRDFSSERYKSVSVKVSHATKAR